MATNRPDTLDPALLRPGRLDRKIEVPLPNEQARLDILKIHAAPVNKGGDIDYEAIVKVGIFLFQFLLVPLFLKKKPCSDDSRFFFSFRMGLTELIYGTWSRKLGCLLSGTTGNTLIRRTLRKLLARLERQRSTKVSFFTKVSLLLLLTQRFFTAKMEYST